MSPLVYSKASGVLIRMTLLASLWWIIVQGRADAWLIGLPAVVLATMASVDLSGHRLPRGSLVGLIGFVALFLRESVSGGVDVARRTLTPKLNIHPGFTRYRVHLNDPLGRVLLINCISLLPGTLAADYDGDHVDLHMLDSRVDPKLELLRLEQAIAGLFGLTMETDNA
jgi:multicomponent Na+:H+ antiporter subunit E